MEAMEDMEVSHVSAGSQHSLLVTREGDVYACGCNFSGQCGSGGKTALETPTKIKFLEGIKIITASAGSSHSFFLSSKLARRQRLTAQMVIGRIRNQSLAKAWDAWQREVDASYEIADWLHEAAGLQQEESWTEARAEAQTLLTWVFRDMDKALHAKEQLAHSEAWSLFKAFDLDGSGALSPSELRLALDSFGYSEEEVDFIILRCSDDPDSQVDFDGFLQGIWPVISSEHEELQ